MADMLEKNPSFTGEVPTPDQEGTHRKRDSTNSPTHRANLDRGEELDGHRAEKLHPQQWPDSTGEVLGLKDVMACLIQVEYVELVIGQCWQG